ncbi:MAG: hypothetical protein HZA01_09740 [Nitrospinae bacterium]|nr:hypothetical protein [Nitrospinota bacterium]
MDPYKKQEQNNYVVVCNAEYEATLKQLKKYGKTRVSNVLMHEKFILVAARSRYGINERRRAELIAFRADFKESLVTGH